MRKLLFLIPLALSSAACSSGEDFARETGADASATARSDAKPVRFEDNSKTGEAERNYSYAWPAEVSAIPALVSQLTAERDKALAEQKSEWEQALKDSPADCISCRSRSLAKEWKLVADTPDYLSLSAQTDTYTGGAHGIYGLQSLVWDKKAGKALDGVELFRSPAALETALGPRLCEALNAEREKKRGEPVEAAGAGEDFGFDDCQHVADATVLVGSSTGKAFDRIGIWYGPYVAGPYAEGAYELNFPVDAAVIEAVKPEFRGGFSERR